MLSSKLLRPLFGLASGGGLSMVHRIEGAQVSTKEDRFKTALYFVGCDGLVSLIIKIRRCSGSPRVNVIERSNRSTFAHHVCPCVTEKSHDLGTRCIYPTFLLPFVATTRKSTREWGGCEPRAAL